MRPGDLVKTSDGYYGIVENIEECTVMLGNGLVQFLSEKEWDDLENLPINDSIQTHANFFELLNLPEIN